MPFRLESELVQNDLEITSETTDRRSQNSNAPLPSNASKSGNASTGKQVPPVSLSVISVSTDSEIKVVDFGNRVRFISFSFCIKYTL